MASVPTLLRKLAKLTALAGGAFGVRQVLNDGSAEKLARSARVARLSTRRAGHYGAMKLRGAASDEARRAELDQEFLIRSAEDVAKELGNMKGAMMKAGQMLSFLFDGLPPEAQQSLATLRADAPPMAPSLAAQVVADELGAPPEKVFLSWTDLPIAAASIGQVHKATLRDGREVAVKVQYPGIDTALESDLVNVRVMFKAFSNVALKGMDVDTLTSELYARMLDELDYEHEASCQAAFAERYQGHPFVRIPAVIQEFSTRKVLTTEWVEGMGWDDFLKTSNEAQRQYVAEVLFRFIQGSIYRDGVFNGDPHPGNYLFGTAGTADSDEPLVTFLDFGLVKRWEDGELESLTPLTDPLLRREPEELVANMVSAGFLQPDHGLDPEQVWQYVIKPYTPFLEQPYTYAPDFVQTALGGLLEVDGPLAKVMNALDMPSSFVILDRVVWGLSAMMGHLRASNDWRTMLEEYTTSAAPSTELGRREAAWAAARNQ